MDEAALSPVQNGASFHKTAILGKHLVVDGSSLAAVAGAPFWITALQQDGSDRPSFIEVTVCWRHLMAGWVAHGRLVDAIPKVSENPRL